MTLGPIEKIFSLTALALCAGACTGESNGPSSTFGGFWPRDTQTAVFNHTEQAFRQPVRNLSPTKRARFIEGRQIFEQEWSEDQGLGPSWNAAACITCHALDGRSAPIERGQPTQALLLRTLLPSSSNTTLPSPVTGWQLGTSAPTGTSPEGTLRVVWTSVDHTYDDGTPYTLIAPTWRVTSARQELPLQETWSARAAPPLIGLGLLEAIDEDTLLGIVRAQRSANQGIAGRISRLDDGSIGRFGWKASQASIAAQHAGALWLDMGLTSASHPTEDCAPALDVCAASASPSRPEVDGVTKELLDDYVSWLGPPASRDAPKNTLERGAALFESLQCSACHVPTLITGSSSAHRALRKQIIHPYTDLLLHDMGDELADKTPDGATSSLPQAPLWRTPALWGIGLTHRVNQHTRFLHDGRARTIEEAILWHGGEGKYSRDGFKALSEHEREALMEYVRAL